MLKAAYVFFYFQFLFYKKIFQHLDHFKHNRAIVKQIFIDNAIHNTVSNQCLNLPLYILCIQ